MLFCGNVFFPLSFFIFSISIIILRKCKGAQSQYMGSIQRKGQKRNKTYNKKASRISINFEVFWSVSLNSNIFFPPIKFEVLMQKRPKSIHITSSKIRTSPSINVTYCAQSSMHSSLQIHHIKQNGIAFHVPHYLSCKTVLSNRIISPLRHHKITELGITHEIPNKLEVSMGQVNSG